MNNFAVPVNLPSDTAEHRCNLMSFSYEKFLSTDTTVIGTIKNYREMLTLEQTNNTVFS
jgi:hypothetical protein